MGGTDELEARLRELLKDLPPLSRLPASAQTLKDLAAAGRTLVLFHAGLSMEDRKRAKILLETLQAGSPSSSWARTWTPGGSSNWGAT